MELPAPLRVAVDRLLDETPLSTLRDASRRLTERYRAERRDGRLHLNDDIAVRAYLAARLPATYAAVRVCLQETAAAIPDFSPKTLLDIGAGPGTVLWACADQWSELERAALIETSRAARSVGIRLATDRFAAEIEWIDGDVTGPLPGLKPADLVTAAYVLDEIAPSALPAMIDRLWNLTADTLLIVEPGTPAGWRRILDARDRLLAQGGHVIAPCPHDRGCPLVAPDWCHFARRVARSRIHRLVKEADVPWEDEKFIYVALSRRPAARRLSRVLAPARAGSGKVTLKLCEPEGRCRETTITKRDVQAYKAARRADWGGTLPAGPETSEE